MRIPSNLLSIFKGHDGSLQPDDGVLDIPAALLPFVEIPEITPATYFGDQGTGDIKSTSFLWSDSLLRTNAAGVNEAIRLSKGIWDFKGHYNYVASYTDIAGAIGGFAIQMSSLGGLQDWLLVASKPVANNPISGFIHWRVSLDRDDWILNAILQTNGVGETDFFNYAISATRLG